MCRVPRAPFLSAIGVRRYTCHVFVPLGSWFIHLGGAPCFGIFSYTRYVLAPRGALSYPLGVVFLMLESLVIHIMCLAPMGS